VIILFLLIEFISDITVDFHLIGHFYIFRFNNAYHIKEDFKRPNS